MDDPEPARMNRSTLVHSSQSTAIISICSSTWAKSRPEKTDIRPREKYSWSDELTLSWCSADGFLERSRRPTTVDATKHHMTTS